MKAGNNDTEFSLWLEQAALNGLLRFGGIKLKHIDKIETEIFVANNEEGDALCIFEVGKEKTFRKPRNSKPSFLEKLPPWTLKIPGYLVLYQNLDTQGSREIGSFEVRKYFPTGRFVGSFSPREFGGFMASTIDFCKKKHEKEIAK